MAALFDIFKFNNIPYAELTNKDSKKEIESWVDKLKDTPIAEQILKDHSYGCINHSNIWNGRGRRKLYS